MRGRVGLTEVRALKNRNFSLDQRLEGWYASARGRSFAEQVETGIAPWLEGAFGYHGVQIGDFPPGRSLLALARTNHSVIADRRGRGQVICAPEAMPFESDSVDLLILPHTLELSGDPRAVLREAERVLIAEGRLLIVGLDPWTLWAALQRLRGNRYPLYTQGRIRDWLELLGLELERSLLLPMWNPGMPRWLARWPKTQQLGRLFASNLAGGYAVLAQKRVASVTPLRMRWRMKPRLVAGRLVNPVAQGVKRGGQN